MKRKKKLTKPADHAPAKNKSGLEEPRVLNYKPCKTSKLIFDIRKEFIDIDDEAVLRDLSTLFKKYVIEYDMMVSMVYFDPHVPSEQYTILFSQIDPKQLRAAKRMVTRKDVIVEIYGRQALKEYYKNSKLNITEQYYETPETVYPDEYRKHSPGMLRTTMIVQLLRNGAPIQAVAQQAGQTIATTATYAPKLTAAQILRNYQRAHPKA